MNLYEKEKAIFVICEDTESRQKLAKYLVTELSNLVGCIQVELTSLEHQSISNAMIKIWQARSEIPALFYVIACSKVLEDDIKYLSKYDFIMYGLHCELEEPKENLIEGSVIIIKEYEIAKTDDDTYLKNVVKDFVEILMENFNG